MQPLEGLTVVALEQAVAAPFATRQLADLGARVIKVERPGSGDFAREYDRSVKGGSSYFVWLNRGKESVALDLKDAQDRAVLDALLEKADVLLQNLAPGAVERLGLDAATLRERRPELIHCSISGYGEPGPYTGRKAYDLLVQCETGMPMTTGTPDEPSKVGVSIADVATGMYAYSGVLTALLRRATTGKGATIQVSMIDALGEWMTQPAYREYYSGRDFERTGARHASIAPYGPYRAGDGQLVFLGVQSDREWALLCTEVMHRPELITDPRFARNTERVENDALTRPHIEQAFAHLTADEAATLLDSVGIANARLRKPGELIDHPQLVARERWQDVETPHGQIRALLPPVVMNDARPRMDPVPSLGQHTQAIRDEVACRKVTTV